LEGIFIERFQVFAESWSTAFLAVTLAFSVLLQRGYPHSLHWLLSFPCVLQRRTRPLHSVFILLCFCNGQTRPILAGTLFVFRCAHRWQTRNPCIDSCVFW
jgi:hypothetical protein